MAICPNCLYEYVEGIKVCPDCGATLVDELKETDWEVIYTSDKDYEIQMMKSALESADIEANILSQKDSSFPATGDLAVIKLLVKREDVNAALSYIKDLKNSEASSEE